MISDIKAELENLTKQVVSKLQPAPKVYIVGKSAEEEIAAMKPQDWLISFVSPDDINAKQQATKKP